MTEKERKEISDLIRETMHECNTSCSLGIKPETAHELISFADTWKTCRRAMQVGIITVVVGGIITAIVVGVKQMVK